MVNHYPCRSIHIVCRVNHTVIKYTPLYSSWLNELVFVVVPLRVLQGIVAVKMPSFWRLKSKVHAFYFIRISSKQEAHEKVSISNQRELVNLFQARKIYRKITKITKALSWGTFEGIYSIPLLRFKMFICIPAQQNPRCNFFSRKFKRRSIWTKEKAQRCFYFWEASKFTAYKSSVRRKHNTAI